mmetsp:Transcript_27380/g.65705  ORF Transcript_27380/g.65705 Transcript_27380/m.65705 type:complete len:181 (-) Transcript_27380:1423-1965(-)
MAHSPGPGKIELDSMQACIHQTASMNRLTGVVSFGLSVYSKSNHSCGTASIFSSTKVVSPCKSYLSFFDQLRRFVSCHRGFFLTLNGRMAGGRKQDKDGRERKISTIMNRAHSYFHGSSISWFKLYCYFLHLAKQPPSTSIACRSTMMIFISYMLGTMTVNVMIGGSDSTSERSFREARS